jgi:hypothetical protein
MLNFQRILIDSLLFSGHVKMENGERFFDEFWKKAGKYI